MADVKVPGGSNAPSHILNGINPDGLLGGWQPPDWNLASSGLSAVLDPETIADIDFDGQRTLSPPISNSDQTLGGQPQPYMTDFQSMHLPDQVPPPVTGHDPKTLHPSDRATDFIKSWEQGPNGGPAFKQYSSPEGGADTIGWGHKIRPGEDFSKGLTKDQADQLFARDLSPAEKLVQARVKVPVSQQQYDALVSLAYNLPSALDPKHSTLLGELNNYDYGGAGGQYFRWNVAGSPSRPMTGLSERRAGEWNMFVNGVYSNHK